MLPLDKTRLIFIIIVIISIKLYIDHRNINYNGQFDINGNYDNITPLKKDIGRLLVIHLSFLLVYGPSLGLGYSVPFFNNENIIDSWIGRSFVLIGSMVIYYDIVEPYLLNKIKFI